MALRGTKKSRKKAKTRQGNRDKMKLVPKSVYATSGYRSNMRAASTSSGGALGRGGRAISRAQRYYDMRVAFGLSAG